MDAKEPDGFAAGLRDIAPLALGVAIYGLAFGLLAAQAHFGPLDIGVMGALVFAGGSQIVAAQQLIAGAGAPAAIVAGLAVNLRLLLITASIRDVFARRPWREVALGAHLSTDENWALMIRRRAQGHAAGYAYLVAGGLCLMFVWCATTMLGALFAHAIPDPKALGMDFAFTSAFIAIARSLWKGRQDILPWCVSLAVVVGAAKGFGLDAGWALVLGGLCGAAVAGVFGHD